ncbi:hypothetical protein GP486_002131 [Trichoglossum hirsutum]|uniref:Uncharacterized protein n=1 Tax=Trichoglossum hirsutum TaxID=265104 RepID=A0A9P8LFK8_9PEZI|nr:hypothetical protein GP486_002131 [Trichoglossum hirsutum]
MSSILCCRHPRTISPIPEDRDGLNCTQRSHAWLSRHSHLTGPTALCYASQETEDLSSLRTIFGDTRENETQGQLPYSHQGTLNHEELGQQQQAVQLENSGSFSAIRKSIRKRLSRNLALSSTPGGGRTGDETSPLEIEQRTRSIEDSDKCLQHDLLTDKGAEEGGYDVDAWFVGTQVSADSILEQLEAVGSRPVSARYSNRGTQQTPMSREDPGDKRQVQTMSNTRSENSRQR